MITLPEQRTPPVFVTSRTFDRPEDLALLNLVLTRLESTDGPPPLHQALLGLGASDLRPFSRTRLLTFSTGRVAKNVVPKVQELQQEGLGLGDILGLLQRGTCVSCSFENVFMPNLQYLRWLGRAASAADWEQVPPGLTPLGALALREQDVTARLLTLPLARLIIIGSHLLGLLGGSRQLLASLLLSSPALLAVRGANGAALRIVKEQCGLSAEQLLGVLARHQRLLAAPRPLVAANLAAATCLATAAAEATATAASATAATAAVRQLVLEDARWLLSPHFARLLRRMQFLVLSLGYSVQDVVRMAQQRPSLHVVSAAVLEDAAAVLCALLGPERARRLGRQSPRVLAAGVDARAGGYAARLLPPQQARTQEAGLGFGYRCPASPLAGLLPAWLQPAAGNVATPRPPQPAGLWGDAVASDLRPDPTEIAAALDEALRGRLGFDANQLARALRHCPRLLVTPPHIVTANLATLCSALGQAGAREVAHGAPGMLALPSAQNHLEAAAAELAGALGLGADATLGMLARCPLVLQLELAVLTERASSACAALADSLQLQHGLREAAQLLQRCPELLMVQAAELAAGATALREALGAAGASQLALQQPRLLGVRSLRERVAAAAGAVGGGLGISAEQAAWLVLRSPRLLYLKTAVLEENAARLCEALGPEAARQAAASDPTALTPEFLRRKLPKLSAASAGALSGESEREREPGRACAAARAVAAAAAAARAPRRREQAQARHGQQQQQPQPPQLLRGLKKHLMEYGATQEQAQRVAQARGFQFKHVHGLRRVLEELEGLLGSREAALEVVMRNPTLAEQGVQRALEFLSGRGCSPEQAGSLIHAAPWLLSIDMGSPTFAQKLAWMEQETRWPLERLLAYKAWMRASQQRMASRLAFLRSLGLLGVDTLSPLIDPPTRVCKWVSRRLGREVDEGELRAWEEAWARS